MYNYLNPNRHKFWYFLDLNTGILEITGWTFSDLGEIESAENYELDSIPKRLAHFAEIMESEYQYKIPPKFLKQLEAEIIESLPNSYFFDFQNYWLPVRLYISEWGKEQLEKLIYQGKM